MKWGKRVGERAFPLNIYAPNRLVYLAERGRRRKFYCHVVEEEKATLSLSLSAHISYVVRY